MSERNVPHAALLASGNKESAINQINKLQTIVGINPANRSLFTITINYHYNTHTHTSSKIMNRIFLSRPIRHYSSYQNPFFTLMISYQFLLHYLLFDNNGIIYPTDVSFNQQHVIKINETTTIIFSFYFLFSFYAHKHNILHNTLSVIPHSASNFDR